jgi:hypothetical protein
MARMRSITLGLIVVMLGAARPRAGAADAADARLPEYWLARAQSAVGTVDPLHKPTSPPLTVLDAAMAIHEVSPTPERRKWIGNLASRVEAGLKGLEDPLRRSQQLGPLTRAYGVILNDEAAYQRCLRHIRAMIDAGQIKTVFTITPSDMLAHVMADAGDMDGVTAQIRGMPGPVERAQAYVKIVRVFAHTDPPAARRVLALALKEAEGFQKQEPFKQLMDDLAEPYVRLGEFDQAVKAMTIAWELKPRLFSAVRLMELAKAAGNEAAYVAFHDLANTAAVKGYAEDHLSFAGSLADLGDRERALAQAKAAIARFGDRNLEWWDCARLASVFAQAGDKAAYQTWIDRAQTAVVKSTSSSANDKPRGYFSLAVARAYAGEMEFVHQHVKAASDVPGLTDSDLYDERYQLITALRKTRKWDEAAAQIEAFKQQNSRDSEHCWMAYDLAAAGRFHAAQQHARKAQEWYRLRAWLRVCRERARAGKLDGLEKWVDELESPLDRAIANVYVAHTLAGRKHGRYWWMLGDQ